MKKLYSVKVDVEFVCLAENERDAIDAAKDALDDGAGVEFYASPLRFLPFGWDGREFPWCVDPDAPELCVNAWIEAGAAPELAERMAKRASDTKGSAVVIADSLTKLLLEEVYLKGEADERSVWQENVPDIEAMRKLARVAEDVAVIANTSPDALAGLPSLEVSALRNLIAAVREWKAASRG